MSTEWPLRQDPEGPVIIALALVNDPDALGFVVLDDEDDWFISDGTELSDDVLVNRESFRKMSLREAVELLPQLTVEQQAEILANLLEAREYAMDAGSSDEKHAWFGKYKGRINNYLSAAGYDLKRAEQDLATRKKPAPPATR